MPVKSNNYVINRYLKNPFYGWIAFVLFCLAGITDFFVGYFLLTTSDLNFCAAIFIYFFMFPNFFTNLILASFNPNKSSVTNTCPSQ